MKEKIQYTIWAKTQIDYFRRKGYSTQQILSFRTNKKGWRTTLWENLVLSWPERQPTHSFNHSIIQP